MQAAWHEHLVRTRQEPTPYGWAVWQAAWAASREHAKHPPTVITEME